MYELTKLHLDIYEYAKNKFKKDLISLGTTEVIQKFKVTQYEVYKIVRTLQFLKLFKYNKEMNSLHYGSMIPKHAKIILVGNKVELEKYSDELKDIDIKIYNYACETFVKNLISCGTQEVANHFNITKNEVYKSVKTLRKLGFFRYNNNRTQRFCSMIPTNARVVYDV